MPALFAPEDRPKDALSGRRLLIADAAIEVLSKDGARGLTHRAVDGAAGLAEGSTSAYFRRRADLLAAASERLADLYAQDLEWVGRHDPPLPDGAGPSPDAAHDLVRTLRLWTSDARRPRALALFELCLVGTRQPEIGHQMAECFDRLIPQYRAVLAELGVEARGEIMDMLRSMMLGTMFLSIITDRSTVCGPLVDRLLIDGLRSAVR